MSKYRYIIVRPLLERPLLEVYNEAKGETLGRVRATHLSDTIHLLWEPLLMSHSQRPGGVPPLLERF